MKQIPLLKREQHGIAALEFLVAAPVLILLVFAVTELAWAFHQYHTMTRSTQDGARYMASGVMDDSSGIVYLNSVLVQEAGNLVVYGNVTGAGQPLLPNWSPQDISVTLPSANHVRVSASYNYVPLVGRIPAFYGGDSLPLAFQMQSSVEMRAL